MRKIQKILTGTLLGGVLLGGIGTGVALVEYSSFAYAGEKTIGEENLVTREIDFKFEPENGKVVVVRGYWDRNYPNALEEDETVPEGVVRYVVTHNSKITDVELSFETYSQEEMEEVEEMEGVAEGEEIEETERVEAAEDIAEMKGAEEGKEIEETEGVEEAEEMGIQAGMENIPPQGYLSLQVRYVGNDFEMFMQSKDEILNELKQKRISSYNVAYITDVRIKVNPKTMPYLDYETMY